MINLRNTILLLIILLTGNILLCQKDVTDELINELYNEWTKYNDSYSIDHFEGEINKVHALYADKITSENEVENFITKIKNAEADLARKDYGLDWRAGYIHNLSPGETDFDNIIYRSRITSEIGWNVLSNGWIQNKIKAQILENEGKISEFKQEEIEKSVAFAIRWNKIIYSFNLQKNAVLNQRKELAEKRVEVVKKLYLLNKIDQEELLKNLESLADVRSMLRVYSDFNKELEKQYGFNSTDIINLPLIDIDYAYISEKLDGRVPDSINALAIENIDLRHRFVNEINLKPFFRYSYYDLEMIDPSHRDFFSVGVNLGIPLNINRKQKERLKEIKKDYASYIPEEERALLEKNILNNFYEFRFKLKQFSSMHYKRRKYTELIRKENARFSIDYLSFNPVRSLRLLDEIMKIDIEMLDLKQQMYLKLLSIYSDLPYNDIKELVTEKELEEYFDGVDESDKGIYIWDKVFAEHGTEFLLKYLNKRAFSRIIIGFSNNKDHNLKKLEMINSLSKKGVVVELMTGNNKLIDNNPVTYFDTILDSVPLNNIDFLHLDVEPHTFDDWKENKVNYLEKYIVLLDKVRTYCDNKDLKLSVSIPLHYPEEYINQIYELTDLVYFMAYENIKTDYIIRKVSPFPAEKTVIALRTEDFENALEIEEKIIDIQESYKPKLFVIHDVRRLIDLDKK